MPRLVQRLVRVGLVAVPVLAVGIQLVPYGRDRANDVVPRSSRIRRLQGTRARRDLSGSSAP